MEEIIEKLISGFCRTCNDTRTVFCEYECQSTGNFRLAEMGCGHESCRHTGSCLILKEAELFAENGRHEENGGI